jgi:hypothetical protein
MSEKLESVIKKDLLPEDINKLVLSYKSEIESINKKIEEIQSNCKHSEHDIKSIGMGPVKVRKVCKTCDMDLGYPNKDELGKSGY